MLILLPILLLILTAIAVALLRWLRPDFRYLWLVASSGILLAWLSVWFWQLAMPAWLSLPGTLLSDPFTLLADTLNWPYALALTGLTAGVFLTAPARSSLNTAGAWGGILLLTALGLLAVLAENAFTLMLAWSAIDIAELAFQLRNADRPGLTEGAVLAFGARALGTGLLAWVAVTHAPLDLAQAPASAGPYLILAAALRLGVFPLHLPLGSEAAMRREFGSVLRLTAAASSLALLARIPAGAAGPVLTPLLLALTGLTAVYAGWNWLRARDELNGRPFWIIGMASLSIGASLRGSPAGSSAWGAVLLLAGGALFLSSLQQKWLRRALFLGAWGLSALPFSASASAWLSPSSGWPSLLLFVPAQALLMAGLIRHAQRPAKDAFESQPRWSQTVYPIGIGAMLFSLIALGLFGWPGARVIGLWIAGLAAALTGLLLVWLAPRLRVFQPSPHWVGTTSPALQSKLGAAAWSAYRRLGRLGDSMLGLLEGDGGVLWALVVIALFIAYFSAGGR